MTQAMDKYLSGTTTDQSAFMLDWYEVDGRSLTITDSEPPQDLFMDNVTVVTNNGIGGFGTRVFFMNRWVAEQEKVQNPTNDEENEKKSNSALLDLSKQNVIHSAWSWLAGSQSQDSDQNTDRSYNFHMLCDLADQGLGRQTMDAANTPLTLEMMNEAFNKISVSEGTADFIMMNGRQLNRMREMLTSEKKQWKYVQLPLMNQPVLAFEDIPILRNDYLGSDTSDEVYFICTGWKSGVIGICPMREHDLKISVRKLTFDDADTDRLKALQERLIRVTEGDSGKNGTPLFRVSATIGLANFSDSAISRITNLA